MQNEEEIVQMCGNVATMWLSLTDSTANVILSKLSVEVPVMKMMMMRRKGVVIMTTQQISENFSP